MVIYLAVSGCFDAPKKWCGYSSFGVKLEEGETTQYRRFAGSELKEILEAHCASKLYLIIANALREWGSKMVLGGPPNKYHPD